MERRKSRTNPVSSTLSTVALSVERSYLVVVIPARRSATRMANATSLARSPAESCGLADILTLMPVTLLSNAQKLRLALLRLPSHALAAVSSKKSSVARRSRSLPRPRKSNATTLVARVVLLWHLRLIQNVTLSISAIVTRRSSSTMSRLDRLHPRLRRHYVLSRIRLLRSGLHFSP